LRRGKPREQTAAEGNFVVGNAKGDLVEIFFHAHFTSTAILTSGRAAFTATERFEHVDTTGCSEAGLKINPQQAFFRLQQNVPLQPCDSS
jgi:hypothetical protein